MNENNLPKFEVKADLTETIEKAYDDTVKGPLKSASNAIATVLDLFNNTLLYPIQKYNLYAKNKLQNYETELRNRVQSIPTENLVSPRVNIIGPTIDGLKYNLDEEYIKEMFTKILLSEINIQTQSKVLPCYVEIVKQLSCSDAQILKHLSEEIGSQSPILKIKQQYPDGSFSYVSNDLILINDNYALTNLKAINIDNLIRLNLVEVSFSNWLHKTSIYTDAFNKLTLDNKNLFGFSKGIIRITNFGINFIDICLS